MVDVAHRLDPTRQVAVGGAQRPLGSERIDLIGDVAGYNGDGANIADFQEPDVSSVVSEYGSVTSDRPGEYAPGWGDLARDEGWKGRKWRSGQAIWCGFDHGSLFGNDMAKWELWIISVYRNVPGIGIAMHIRRLYRPNGRLREMLCVYDWQLQNLTAYE